MRKSQYFPLLIFSAKRGHYWYPFLTSLVWRGPWLGIDPGTSCTWSQHHTTRLSRRRSLTGNWTRDLPHSKPALYHKAIEEAVLPALKQRRKTKRSAPKQRKKVKYHCSTSILKVRNSYLETLWPFAMKIAEYRLMHCIVKYDNNTELWHSNVESRLLEIWYDKYNTVTARIQRHYSTLSYIYYKQYTCY